MNDEQKGYVELIIYSLLAGTVSVFVKLVNNLDVSAIVFFRALIACLFILIVIIFKKRVNELPLQFPLKTLGVGIFQGLSIFLLFLSVRMTSVSNAIFLLSTAPVFSIIMAKMFLKENIENKTIFGVIVTLVGIVFIIDPRTFSFSSKETLGNLLGLASGFFYASMALTAKPLMKKVSPYYTAFWQYAVISIILLFFVRINSFVVISDNWWKILVIGIMCTGIPFILFMDGIRKIKAQKIFVITALEPVAGTFLALVLLKEVPSVMTAIGAILIFFGIYWVAKKK